MAENKTIQVLQILKEISDEENSVTKAEILKAMKDTGCSTTENPATLSAVIDDILYQINPLEYADEITKEGDIILIAGKGVENYIDENGLKTPYSDFEEVEKLRR